MFLGPLPSAAHAGTRCGLGGPRTGDEMSGLCLESLFPSQIPEPPLKALSDVTFPVAGEQGRAQEGTGCILAWHPFGETDAPARAFGRLVLWPPVPRTHWPRSVWSLGRPPPNLGAVVFKIRTGVHPYKSSPSELGPWQGKNKNRKP